MRAKQPRPVRSVRRRIMQTIVVILVLCCGGAGYTVFAMNVISGNAERLTVIERDVAGVHEAAEKGVLRAQVLLAELQGQLSNSARDTLLAAQTQNDAAVRTALETFDPAVVPGTGAGWSSATAQWEEWVQLRDARLVPPPGVSAAKTPASALWEGANLVEDPDRKSVV